MLLETKRLRRTTPHPGDESRPCDYLYVPSDQVFGFLYSADASSSPLSLPSTNRRNTWYCSSRPRAFLAHLPVGESIASLIASSQSAHTSRGRRYRMCSLISSELRSK